MTLYDREPIVEKISNEHHISDINYAIKYTRWFFIFIGLWPKITGNPSRIKRYAPNLSISFFSIIMMTLPISIVSHIAVREVERLELLVLLGPVSFQSTNVIKYFALIIRSNAVKLCLRHMERDWQNVDNQKERDIMKTNLKIGHGLTKVCVFGMYSCCMFYHAIMPLWTGNMINELNETIRPLAYPGTDIYVDSQARFVYEVVFCGILVSAFFHFTVVSSIFNLAAILVTHACGQIQIVMARLSDLVDSLESENNLVGVWKRIAFIIRVHVRVLRFSSKIDEVLREICLIEVATSALMICLLEYYCLTEWNNGNGVRMITYLLTLFSLGFNIFIYCHIGELLKEQCMRVGKAAYMIDWYKLPGKSSLALVMIITVANYPPKLSAGRMMELSITTFSNIIRTSLAYLNMLRAVAEY